MLTAEPHRIAAPQSGIKQDVEPNPLPRANAPAALVGRDIFFRPWNEAVTFGALRILNPDSRILASLAFAAQRNSPRIASRKCRPWWTLRRSRPFSRLVGVTLLIG